MNMKILIIILLFFIGQSHTQHKANFEADYNILDQYYYHLDTSSVELPQSLVDTTGAFRVMIHRDIKYNHLKNLIEKAEAFYPPKNNIKSENTKLDTTAAENLWWYDTWGKARLPYTITKSSINFYSNLLYTYKKLFNSDKKSNVKSATLSYTASVIQFDSIIMGKNKYKKVKIVNQVLKWHSYTSPLSSLGFTKRRQVVFDKNENIIAVIGDGIPIVIVS